MNFDIADPRCDPEAILDKFQSEVHNECNAAHFYDSWILSFIYRHVKRRDPPAVWVVNPRGEIFDMTRKLMVVWTRAKLIDSEEVYGRGIDVHSFTKRVPWTPPTYKRQK
jgi:hypothetical protein